MKLKELTTKLTSAEAVEAGLIKKYNKIQKETELALNKINQQLVENRAYKDKIKKQIGEIKVGEEPKITKVFEKKNQAKIAVRPNSALSAFLILVAGVKINPMEKYYVLIGKNGVKTTGSKMAFDEIDCPEISADEAVDLINKNMEEKFDNGDQCDCPNCQAERAAKEPISEPQSENETISTYLIDVADAQFLASVNLIQPMIPVGELFIIEVNKAKKTHIIRELTDLEKKQVETLGIQTYDKTYTGLVELFDEMYSTEQDPNYFTDKYLEFFKSSFEEPEIKTNNLETPEDFLKMFEIKNQQTQPKGSKTLEEISEILSGLAEIGRAAKKRAGR